MLFAEPVQLLSVSYQAVSVVRVLTQIAQIQEQATNSAKLQHSLSNIHSTLKNIEATLDIQIYQPLKSGLSMLSDAEAEYLVNRKGGQELANQALLSFNKAEGQISDPENRLIAIIGVACVYKLLKKKGAYNNAARRANDLGKLIGLVKEKVKKLPCKSCGVLILPTTAAKTGGVCMPCFKK